MRRTILAALLLCSMSAWAHSAWVLWVNDENVWDPQGNSWGQFKVEWHIKGGFSQLEECRRALASEIDKVINREPSSDWTVMYKTDGDDVNLLYFPKDGGAGATLQRSQWLRFRCLPDTVDPR